MSKPILIIHPNDKTTKFLNRIKNHLVNNFFQKTHHFNIQYSNQSHDDCLERINSHQANGLIIFLGHGRSDSLYGSKAPFYDNDFVSSDAKEEFPEKYYGKEIFINDSNIKAFKNKHIFCLSCNSNEKISKDAINRGAVSFIGFGDIPSSESEINDYKIDQNIYSIARITRIMKTEINYIFKRSLEILISDNLTFNQLYNLIVFIINQRITDILVNNKELKERYIITDMLYNLKRDMICLGDKHRNINF